MNSFVFLLLSAVFVAVSGDLAELHVKEVSAGYSKLSLTGDTTQETIYSLVEAPIPVAAEESLPIKAGKVDEKKVAVKFIVKSAGIFQPAIVVTNDKACAIGKPPCFMCNTAEASIDGARAPVTKCTIHVSGVKSAQLKFTCESTPKNLDFKISADGSSETNIQVTEGTLDATPMIFKTLPTACKVEASSLISFSENKNCSPETANCFLNAAIVNTSFKVGLFALCLAIVKMI